jgi:hypothetical protein
MSPQSLLQWSTAAQKALSHGTERKRTTVHTRTLEPESVGILVHPHRPDKYANQYPDIDHLHAFKSVYGCRLCSPIYLHLSTTLHKITRSTSTESEPTGRHGTNLARHHTRYLGLCPVQNAAVTPLKRGQCDGTGRCRERNSRCAACAHICRT